MESAVTSTLCWWYSAAYHIPRPTKWFFQDLLAVAHHYWGQMWKNRPTFNPAKTTAVGLWCLRCLDCPLLVVLLCNFRTLLALQLLCACFLFIVLIWLILLPNSRKSPENWRPFRNLSFWRSSPHGLVSRERIVFSGYYVRPLQSVFLKNRWQ